MLVAVTPSALPDTVSHTRYRREQEGGRGRIGVQLLSASMLTSHPKVVWEERVTLAQLYATKILLVSMGRPTFTSKTTPSPWTDPTHRPKRHPDPVSRFTTVHLPVRHTDRPTDGISERSTVYTNSAYALLIVSDALIKLRSCLNFFFIFWPTVLSVVPLARCVVCHLSVYLSSVVVCDVFYCGETVCPSEKVSEGVNRKPGSKSSFFGSPPYFYFRFRRYGHRDDRFCLIFPV